MYIKEVYMTTDLTIGKPSKVILKLSLPMLISVIFQQLYNLADSIIAGQFAGENALAAVGASYPITMIFQSVALGFNIGCSVVISQLFGAKNYNGTKTAIGTTYVLATFISAIITVAGVLMSEIMMVWINTPEVIMGDGVIYLQIFLGGMPFVFLYNATTAVYTALGNTRTPLIFLIISSLLNILLDYILVSPIKMGVAGVAWASFITQGLACIASMIALAFTLKKIKHEGPYKKFSWKMAGNICKVSIPSVLQQSFISVGNILVQSIINLYGEAVIAGFSAATKLNAFAIVCFFNMGNGLSSFTAQNVGANKYERVVKGYNVSIIYILLTALPFTLLFTLGGEYMMKLFVMDISAEALEAGMTMLTIVSPFYLMCVFKMLADGVLRGAGSMGCFMISTFSDLILRVVLSYAMSPAMGVLGVCWAWPIGWGVGTVIATIFYVMKMWLPKKYRKEFNVFKPRPIVEENIITEQP